MRENLPRQRNLISPPGLHFAAGCAARFRSRIVVLASAKLPAGKIARMRPLSMLVLEAASDLCASSDAVVPVPLHPARARERGFNQAADLARLLGRPVLPALCRVRRTPPQVRLPAGQRRRNVRGAFALAPASLRLILRRPDRRLRALTRGGRVAVMRTLVEGRRLLLVDDVCTTGATLEACARVLKDAGAASVSAATVARAVTARRR